MAAAAAAAAAAALATCAARKKRRTMKRTRSRRRTPRSISDESLKDNGRLPLANGTNNRWSAANVETRSPRDYEFSPNESRLALQCPSEVKSKTWPQEERRYEMQKKTKKKKKEKKE